MRVVMYGLSEFELGVTMRTWGRRRVPVEISERYERQKVCNCLVADTLACFQADHILDAATLL